MDEPSVRAAIEHHFATAGSDEATASEIYREDAVVEWPQSGERLRGRATIQAFRESYPARLEFAVRRLVGRGDLWVTEYTIFYDGAPTDAVNVMELDSSGKVVRERIYFAERFAPPAWRAGQLELMDESER